MPRIQINRNRPIKTKSSRLSALGMWQIELYGPDGALKERRVHRNRVVNIGLDWIADYLFTGNNPTLQPDPMSCIAIGTGSTAVASTDTALQSEIAVQEFDNITSGGVGVISVDATFPAGTGTGAITEMGIFSGVTGATTMLNRVVFAAVHKASGDSLKTSFSFTIANSE